MALDQGGDPGGERPLLEAEGAEAGETVAGELGLDPGDRPEEPTHQPLMTKGDEVGGPGAIPRHQAPQIGVEAVADAGHLDDDVLAGLDEELEIEGPVGGPDRRQVGLAGRHPGDRQGITGIALAQPAGPGPLAAGELRRHLPDGQAGGDEEAGGGRPEAGRALDPDDGRRAALDPVEKPAMAGRVVVERRLGHARAELVDAAGHQRRLVGIDPDRAHSRHPPRRIRWLRARRAAVRRGESPRSYEATPGPLVRPGGGT